MTTRVNAHVAGEALEAPPALRFRWPWRPYQARVLGALERHLSDRRLHVVAAPGSGKTVLGLELFRQLGHPALALSPTRTIRDQWLARLCDFLPANAAAPPSWTSSDLAAPAFFTSITYQALHARHRRETADKDRPEPVNERDGGPPPASEVRRLAGVLRRRGIRTLILDEAHHLTKAWWKALAELTGGIPDATIISLTATPPYDALGTEWRRYEALCGPVDEEISVPELVRSGTLCPHHDYVRAVAPHAAERRLLEDRERSIGTVTEELAASPELASAVSRHPWLAEPDARAVLDDTEFAASLLVFLHARSQSLPGPLLELLGADAEDLPPLDRRWWNVLLYHYLFGTTWAESTERVEHRDRLKRQLRERGLLRRRELRLRDDRSLATRLSLSPAKLDACVEIYRLERVHRADGLRQAFLTDYIREREPDRLGVWPLFLRLVAAAAADERPEIALVTGRMAVVHRSILEALPAEVASDSDIAPVPEAPGFVRVRRGDAGLVAPITHALEEGYLRVIVGTRALLGEGWDAPSLNSLVLASYAGSFVSANQMRGRAIRRSGRDPEKVASIWHLVAIDPRSPSGLSDWDNLRDRFDRFVGLAEGRPVIENGLDRLALPSPEAGASAEVISAASADRLADLPRLGARWREGIEVGEHGRVVPAVRVDRAPRRPRVLFSKTLRRLAISGVLFGVGVFEWALRVGVELRMLERPLRLLTIAALIGAAASMPGLARAAWAWLRTLPVDGVLRQIGLAVRDALFEAGALSAEPGTADVEVRQLDAGVHTLALAGESFLDQSIFADAVEEVLGPVENPRYLVTREAGRRRPADYHAVPAILGTNADKARIFHRHWVKRLGASSLVYTRSPEGRAVLLRARSRAFSSTFVPAADRLDRWQ